LGQLRTLSRATGLRVVIRWKYGFRRRWLGSGEEGKVTIDTMRRAKDWLYTLLLTASSPVHLDQGSMPKHDAHVASIREFEMSFLRLPLSDTVAPSPLWANRGAGTVSERSEHRCDDNAHASSLKSPSARIAKMIMPDHSLHTRSRHFPSDSFSLDDPGSRCFKVEGCIPAGAPDYWPKRRRGAEITSQTPECAQQRWAEDARGCECFRGQGRRE
jgi:hypothetical protein